MHYTRQLILLLLMRALNACMISMPVIVIYWQNHGLSVRDIFVLQVIFSIAVVILEVPSGYFADRLGRKTSIMLGNVTGTLGFFVYWAWPSLTGFIVAELVLALSVSLLSGAVEAFLKESLPREMQNSENTKWQGRFMSTGNIAEAVGAMCAGVIAAWYGLETVLCIQWLIMAAAIPLSLMMYETRQIETEQTSAIMTILRGSFKENKRLIALNIYAAGTSAATLSMVWFVQPYWQKVGVNILYFGYLWAGLQCTVALGATLAYLIERKLGFRRFFFGSALLITALYVGMALFELQHWSLILVPIFWFVRGLTNPIVTDYVQREADDRDQATVLSINKLGSRLAFSLFSPFLGWMVDVWSFAAAFSATALIFGSIALIGSILIIRAQLQK